MMKQFKPTLSDSEAGVVLVLVLVTLLSLTSFVIATVEFTTRDAGEVSLVVQEEQAGRLAEGALSVALQRIRQDENATSDTPEEPWVKAWSYRGVRLDIEPSNSRLNLNGLTKGSNKRQKRIREGLRRFFLQKQERLDPIRYLLDWMDEDSENDHDVMGGEGLEYEHREPSYSPRNALLQRPEEVLLIKGWENRKADWIRKQFTIWGENTEAYHKLNINFAPRDILLALIPELKGYWPRIKSYRRREGFHNKDDLLEAIPLEEDTYQNILPYFSVRSDLFVVTIRIEHASCRLKKRYVIKRNNNGLLILSRDVLHVKLLTTAS